MAENARALEDWPLPESVAFHAPGVYFGMPEDEYHADPSLGSTDMKRLLSNPADYWFCSSLNPIKLTSDEEDSLAKLRGHAYHKMVHEGRTTFEACYGVCEFPGNIKAGIEERKALALANRLPLRRADWDRIQLAGGIIRAEPELSESFSGGFAEVSVFWIDSRGIPKKARIDRLKHRASVDLKTIAPRTEIEFERACWNRLAELRYDLQVEHYNEGRAMLRAFLSTGAVHGDHDADLIKSIASERRWASVIVFLKTTNAPLVFGTKFSPENPILKYARDHLTLAEDNYLAYRERFGLCTPWTQHKPLEEADMDNLPQWFGRF